MLLAWAAVLQHDLYLCQFQEPWHGSHLMAVPSVAQEPGWVFQRQVAERVGLALVSKINGLPCQTYVIPSIEKQGKFPRLSNLPG